MTWTEKKIFKKKTFIFIVCSWVFCMYVRTSYAHACLLRPEEPIRSPGSGVRVNCQPHVDSGNQTAVFYESSKCFKPWAISTGPQSPSNWFLLQEDPWGSPASPPNLIGVPGQSVRDHYQKAPGQQYPEEWWLRLSSDLLMHTNTWYTPSHRGYCHCGFHWVNGVSVAEEGAGPSLKSSLLISLSF